MKNLYLTLILGVFTAGLNTVSAQSTVVPAFGKGIFFMAPDTSMSMKMTIRFQSLFVAEKSPGENTHIEKEMMIRRFRLKFDGFAFTPRLKYKLELGLSGRDMAPGNMKQTSFTPGIIYDATLKYALKNNLEIWFGQAKLPGNRERIISSQSLQFVDRSMVNNYFNLDRDLGLQLHHQFYIGKAVVRERVAFSLGQGRNITASDSGGLSYTGRLELLPFGEFESNGDYFDSDLLREETPKVSLAAGYSYNDDAVRSGGELGPFQNESRDLQTFFADVMLKYKGWSLTSEYMNKQSDKNSIVQDSSGYFQTGWGWNIQSGYLFKNNFEIAGRYTILNPSAHLTNAGLNEMTNEYTLGFSKYFKGHNLKIQTDLSYFTFDRSRDAIRYRLQVELAL